MKPLDKLKVSLIFILLVGAISSLAWLYYESASRVRGEDFFEAQSIVLSQATIPLLLIMIGNMFSTNAKITTMTKAQIMIAYTLMSLYSIGLIICTYYDAYYMKNTAVNWLISIQALIIAPIAYIYGKSDSDNSPSD